MVRTAVVAAAVVVGMSAGAVGLVGDPAVGGPPGRPVAGAVPVAPGSVPRPAPDVDGAGTRSPTGTLLPPLVAPVVVARAFDGPAQPWAAGHRGVDLTAHPGQPVLAPGAGVVTFAGTVVDRGVVTVTHADGLRSSLEPVAAAVTTGQRVARAEVVGVVSEAPGHCSPATCLHWGLRRGDTYLDPMRWVLDRGPVVLLPDG